MTAVTEERPIFENEEWLVTEGGLEHKTTGYFIDRESLGQRREDGLWSWPLHMAEKSWCAMMPFAEAFSCAAAVYGIEAGADLAQTLKVARREVSPWPECEKRVFNPAPLVSRALRRAEADPILWKSGSSEQPLQDQGSPSLDDSWRMRFRTGARPFSINAQRHSSPLGVMRAALPWQAQRRLRNTGTRLVRLIQAAWSTR